MSTAPGPVSRLDRQTLHFSEFEVFAIAEVNQRNRWLPGGAQGFNPARAVGWLDAAAGQRDVCAHFLPWNCEARTLERGSKLNFGLVPGPRLGYWPTPSGRSSSWTPYTCSADRARAAPVRLAVAAHAPRQQVVQRQDARPACQQHQQQCRPSAVRGVSARVDQQLDHQSHAQQSQCREAGRQPQ